MENTFLNIRVLSGLLFLAAITASCKKLIEVPGNPPGKITEAQQFADSASTMTAVAGVYSYPSNNGGSFTFNDGYLSVCAGLSSDEISTTSTDINYTGFYNYGLTPINTTVLALWNNPYTGVYPVNAILNSVTDNSGLSETFKKQIVGEMKVLRALYYFNLVNLFGEVPLVTSTDYKVTAKLPRASVNSIYSQILTDLTDAQQALPFTNPSAGRIRPNKYTVMAFLAKVHLYRQEWQAAYDAANTVIASNQYQLESDLNKVFLDGSKEAIWQLPANFSYLVTREALNFVPSSSGIFPTYSLTPYLKNAFETGDQRLQKWVGTATVNVSGTNQNFYYPYKYKNIGSVSPTAEDFMIFRLGEQYLIRAEASANLNHISEAVSDLNFLRARSRTNATDLPDYSPTISKDVCLAAIMHERQTELFCEWGNRWFDLKRTGAANTLLGAEKAGWKSTAVLYPVPNAQIQLNYLLTQNPGYN